MSNKCSGCLLSGGSLHFIFISNGYKLKQATYHIGSLFQKKRIKEIAIPQKLPTVILGMPVTHLRPPGNNIMSLRKLLTTDESLWQLLMTPVRRVWRHTSYRLHNCNPYQQGSYLVHSMLTYHSWDLHGTTGTRQNATVIFTVFTWIAVLIPYLPCKGELMLPGLPPSTMYPVQSPFILYKSQYPLLLPGYSRPNIIHRFHIKRSDIPHDRLGMTYNSELDRTASNTKHL